MPVVLQEVPLHFLVILLVPLLRLPPILMQIVFFLLIFVFVFSFVLYLLLPLLPVLMPFLQFLSLQYVGFVTARMFDVDSDMYLYVLIQVIM